MIDLTVKTLDSRNHAFSMPDDATVLQLKTKIEESMNIPANRQRLIFHGRVMQDDKKLSEYEVHGMVIHLVKSPPPQPGSRQGGNSSSTSTSNNDNPSRPSGARYLGHFDGGTMFGSVLIPVVGERAVGGRYGAWRFMSHANRMIQRATEVLDNFENSSSRSTSNAASATTTPYNSSRDSSGTHSPATEPTQAGKAAMDANRPSVSTRPTSEPSTSSEPTAMETDVETENVSSPPHITVSNADQTSSSSSASNTAPGTTQEGSARNSAPQFQRGTTTTSNMSALLTRLRALQARFDPLLSRYHNLITEDPATNNPQQLAERTALTQTVPEVLHLLSHAYHAISDLSVDWDQAPPRHMRPLLSPAIQQLVQLTEGINQWGITIPPTAFGQQGLSAASATSNSTAASNTAPTGTTTGAANAPSAPPAANPSEVTYMTTTFPAEGGEATTTFTTRPAANFESAPTASNSTGNSATNRAPNVAPSEDISARNPALHAALTAAYALANRLGHQAATAATLHSHSAQQFFNQQQDQQQPQQPQQSQPTRGGSIVTLPVGMIDIPTNLEFFMEVGPSTITIDSLDVTTGTGTNNGTADGNSNNANYPWGGHHPEAFLQGVVHALNRMITTPGANPNFRRRGSAPESTPNPNSQRRGSAPESDNAEASGSANSSNGPASGNTPSASSPPGGAGSQTSQARGYTATHPTTSTQTRSTARPHVHHIATAPFPGLQVGGFTDPLLPCNSQFFASWRRSRTNANNSTANSATQTNNSTSSAATSRSSNTLSASASGYGSSQSPRTAPSSSASQGSNQSARPTSIPNLLESLMQENADIRNDFLTAVINLLVTASSQENQTNEPIINWLNRDSSNQEGESLLSDLQLAVIRSVTASNLLALFEGNWSAVNHVRTDLHQFVVQRLCEGSPTEENLERGLNLLMAELRPHFNLVTDLNVRNDIDIVASVIRYHESVLPQFFKLILDDGNASNFGQNLLDMVNKYLSNLWAIFKHCCADDDVVQSIFSSCMNRLPDGVSSARFSLTARMCLDQLRLYADSTSVPPQDIESFIVYHASVPEVLSTASTSSGTCGHTDATSGQSSGERSVEKISSVSSIEPMDTDSQSPPQATSSATVASVDMPCHSNASEEAATAKTIETSEMAPLDADVPPVPTPEAWHRIIPSEWVPIIARDATRQRRPNSQTPLSDAYLAGMPPKRRKVVTADKPQGSLSEVISANMESAIQSSGVSTAGISLVQEEAGNDPRLREAYRDQLRATVRANLANNPDFTPERFPNAAQYFGKS